MKNKTFLSITIFAISLLIIPQMAFASWWKPNTWKIFNRKAKIKTEQKIIATSTPNNVISQTEKATTTPTLSRSSGQSVGAEKIEQKSEEAKKQKAASSFADTSAQKNDQSKEIEKLRKEVEALKQKQSQFKIIEKITEKPITAEKKESSSSQTKQNENIVTLPNGAVVEMDAKGNIVKIIKEATETTNIETKVNNGGIEVSKRPFVGDLILKEKTNINGILNFRIYAKDNDVNIEGVKIKVGGSTSLSVINSVFATNGGGVYVTNQNSQLDENGEAILNFKLGIKTGSYYDLMIGAYINQNEDENKNIYMSVIGLVTSSEISGLPINGDVYTIKNQRLPKVTVSPGQVDIRYLFSAIKITSDKKVFLISMKWYQSGSGNAENIKTYIGNTSYEAVSSDSKYFTSNFGGMIINPNETKEIYVKGDNISQQGQWLSFDIYKASDINITDENGNVIIPQAEQLWDYENSGGFRTGNPWYDGLKIEIKN